MNCFKCKSWVSDGTTTCPYCGTNLSNQSMVEQPLQSQVSQTVEQPVVQPVQPIQSQPINNQSTQNIVQQPVQQNINSQNIQPNQSVNSNQNSNVVFQPQINNSQPIQPSISNVNELNSVNQFANNSSNIELSKSQSTHNLKSNEKSNSKNAILIIVIIAIIIGGVFLFKKFILKDDTSNSDILMEDTFAQDNLIQIEDNKLYGYIDTNGKIVIPIKYKGTWGFNGNYMIVELDSDKTQYTIIDKKDNQMIEPSDVSPKYDETGDVWIVTKDSKIIVYNNQFKQILTDYDNLYYVGSGYFTYTDKEKYETGLINYKGKKIYSKSGSHLSIDICDTDDKSNLYATVTYSQIISLNSGKIIYTLDDSENYIISEENDGIFQIFDTKTYKDKKWLYVHNDKIMYKSDDVLYDLELYDSENQILELDYGYDYDKLGKSDRYAYYDAKNQKMLSNKPSSSSSSSDVDIDLTELAYGYKISSESGKYGIMKGTSKVLPNEYDKIEFVNISLFKYLKEKKNQELVLLQKDGKTSLMNLKNKKVLYTFNSIYVKTDDDDAFVEAYIYEKNGYTKTSTTVYNILTGASKEFDSSSKILSVTNYLIEYKDNKEIYYNTKLKQIYTKETK